jgi:hypothetical protein
MDMTLYMPLCEAIIMISGMKSYRVGSVAVSSILENGYSNAQPYSSILRLSDICWCFCRMPVLDITVMSHHRLVSIMLKEYSDSSLVRSSRHTERLAYFSENDFNDGPADHAGAGLAVVSA